MKINFQLKDLMLTMPKIVKSVAQAFPSNSEIQKRFIPECSHHSFLWIIKSKKHLLIDKLVC